MIMRLDRSGIQTAALRYKEGQREIGCLRKAACDLVSGSSLRFTRVNGQDCL